MKANPDYGAPPGPEQLEVTLLGPGYGEAVLLHLGHGRWMLIDSCIEKGSKTSASLEYLDAIGVSETEVKVIVASHWHDDHIRGLSHLVRRYKDAELFIPGVFARKEALEFLAAFSGVESNNLSRGTRELRTCLDLRPEAIIVKERMLVYESATAAVRVVAYSPTEPAFANFLAGIFGYLPDAAGITPIGNAPDLSPNFTSIVLQVEIADDAILLGADLEDHAEFGWTALLGKAWCLSRRKASVYKVAHHGSKTGHNPRIWSEFLKEDPIALVSPFVRGRHSLPSASEREAIKSQTGRGYLTSISSKKPQLPSEQLKRLRDMCKDLVITEQGFGGIRLRRELVPSAWQVELFGSASPLGKATVAAK